jgi:WD40 repeat protein
MENEAKAVPGQIVLWSRKTRMQDGEAIPVPDGVRDVAWSPDGALLAAASGKQVHFYDPATRREKRTLAAHQGPITGLAFAPDGHRLVTAGQDGLIKLWSVPEGKVVNAYELHRNPAGRPAFSPDGSRLATFGGVGDEIVVLWETASGKGLGQLVIAPAQIQNVSFDKDGQTLAIAVKASAVRMWNTRVLAMVDTTPRPRGKATRPEEAVALKSLHTELRMVRFSPDGKTLASSGRGGDLSLLDTKGWTQRALKSGGKPNLTFAYNGDGRLLAAAGGGPADGHVYLRDGATGGLRGDFPAGNGYVRAVAVSADGKLVAVGFDSVQQQFAGPAPQNASASVHLWDIADEPKLLGTFEKLTSPLGGLAFAPDGKTLYAAAGPRIRRWQTTTREELPPFSMVSGNLTALVVAPNGHVYAGGVDLLIHSWDADGRHTVLWEGHQLPIRGLALTGDGRRLASVAEDHTCRVWDTATGETTAVTEDNSRPFASVATTGVPAFSPDGSLLVVGTDASSVSVLRTAQLKEMKEPKRLLPLPTKKPSSEPAAVAAFSAQSNYFRDPLFSSNDTLLTATANGPVLRWNWPAGTLRDERHHLMTVGTMARSQDGKVIVLKAGSAIYLRNGTTGKLLGCIQPEFSGTDPFANLSHAALSPQGDLVAGGLSQRKKHELIVWDVRDGRQRVAAELSGSPNSLAFTPDGKKLAASLYVDAAYRILFYDPLTLKKETRTITLKDWAKELAFSPDGKGLAVCGSRGMVTLWDLDRDKELWGKGLGQPNVGRLTLGFSPDGKWLLAGPSRQKGLVLVDAATGEVRADVTRHANINSGASFSPDGKFLAVVQDNASQVVVYDVEKLVASKP